MSHKIIKTDRAPAAIGPYSQGVVGCGLLFTAMQIALDPASGEMTGSTASEQVNRCLKNVAAIAKAAGCSLDHAVKVTVYLTDMTRCEPGSAVTKRFARDAWKAVEYETGEFAGTMLYSIAGLGSPELTFRLDRKGWYAVYLGLHDSHQQYQPLSAQLWPAQFY